MRLRFFLPPSESDADEASDFSRFGLVASRSICDMTLVPASRVYSVFRKLSAFAASAGADAASLFGQFLVAFLSSLLLALPFRLCALVQFVQIDMADGLQRRTGHILG